MSPLSTRTRRRLFLAALAFCIAVAPLAAADSLSEAETNLKAHHYAAARRVIVPAAEAGDAYAQYLLAGMYLNGAGVTQDIDKAVELLRQAVAQGFARAQGDLGAMYVVGRNVDRDVARGLDLLGKASAAGDAGAEYNLAVLYRDGVGVGRDRQLARQHFVTAANKGYELAQYQMARFCYDEGDYAHAIDWYRKSADQGDLEALYNLAYMYYSGTGTERDYAQANQLFLKNAVLGSFEQDGARQFKALDMLGNAYRDGLGVKVDYVEAYKWYYLAAARGHTLAARQLQEIAPRLSADQIAEAKARAEAFASHPQ